jgi:hypothetical protein
MTFRVPIDDINHPINSAFIKIGGDGMVQTVPFNPGESLQFTVYLSNGELFETLMQDFYSPKIPNPLVQISALFGIRRVQYVIR